MCVCEFVSHVVRVFTSEACECVLQESFSEHLGFSGGIVQG